jgi:hypothetical protein
VLDVPLTPLVARWLVRLHVGQSRRIDSDELCSQLGNSMTARATSIACLSAVVALVAFGLLLLLLADPNWLEEGFLILMYGTVFGQTSLAAMWCAFGPFPLARRLPLASIWLALIVLCSGWNRADTSSPSELNVLLTFAAIVPSQWALVTAPMCCVASWHRLRFVQNGVGANEQSSPRRERQIGIREAMFLTAVVAVVLGAARYKLGELSEASVIWEDLRVFALLTLASTAIALAFIAGSLLVRSWLLAITGALVIVTVFTALEFCLLPAVSPGGRIDERLCWIVSLINFVQSTWIIAVLCLLRLGGFQVISGSALQAR